MRTASRPAAGLLEGSRRWALARVRRSFRVLGLFLALAAIWVFFALSSEFFFTQTNILNILLQASNVAIVAAGLTVVVITAEIDLSVGSLEALAGAIAAIVIIREGVPVAIGIPVGARGGRARGRRQRRAHREAARRLVRVDARDAGDRAGHGVPAHERPVRLRLPGRLPRDRDLEDPRHPDAGGHRARPSS